MSTDTTIRAGSDSHTAAKRLIQAAADFWEVSEARAAVVWLEDSNGQVLIFTRGEYRDVIMGAVRDHDPATPRPALFFEVEETTP